MAFSSRVLSVVPARAGSKGLPDKNIRPLLDKPLLAWSIQSSLACSLIDDTILSTDSQVYADIGINYGAKVPFLRPHDLSSDSASSIDVVLHALDEMAKIGHIYDIVVLIEPTSPLRRVSDVELAIKTIRAKSALSVVGISLAEAMHPSFLFRLNKDNLLSPLLGLQPNALRRQDLDPIYYLNGCVYASDVACLREKRAFCHEYTSGVIVPNFCAPEIDSELDFKLVEVLLDSMNSL